MVLDDISLTIPEGKTTCIMAPSGRGKTTLLRILMGLENADSGSIFGLENARKSAVFQEDRLCENLSPVSNIRLTNPRLQTAKVLEAMNAVGLSGCENKPVSELSGGMCRRVAILRALLSEYDVLFLDEPFKGLDAKTKELVIHDTKMRCAGRTVLLVTHDETEALLLDAADVIRL